MDNDWKPDENNSYTHTSLKKENLPPSFTICTAFMVEAWNEYETAVLYELQDDEGKTWHWAKIYAAKTFTKFSFQFEDSPTFSRLSDILFYPLQWTRVCLSRDSNTSLVRLVVDSELLIEEVVKLESLPGSLNLVLGLFKSYIEFPGQTTNLNIFSSALSVEQMNLQTTAGFQECGLPGDFLSWEKSIEERQWTLHSKARWVEFDGGLEGPCRARAKMNVFPIKVQHRHSECMRHCEKLRGRSPSVKTETEWEYLWKEIKLLSPDSLRLQKDIWLSVTEGDVDNELAKLDHWPEKVEPKEGVWRDYYTGEQLGNYSKPWQTSNRDKDVGETHNCLFFEHTQVKINSWKEWQCSRPSRGCPCTYETPPLIHLRGFCPNTLLEHHRYTVAQTATDPSNIILVGYQSARIEYDFSLGQWTLKDSRFNITAMSHASHKSFALGKHKWTVSGDKYQCFGGKEYTLQMKLTGCNSTQFTCDDGQCVNMEERCNQTPNCEDKSDETDCKILALEKGYNKRVPPVGTIGGRVKTLKPVEVNVSLTLFKVVAMAEEDHSIELQFQISLEWKENRATYYNLKSQSYRNALSEDEFKRLWLPLVVYVNTDNYLTTRLGQEWEWSTDVDVKKEGNFTRSGFEVLDEIYLFKGEENGLIMTQSYTHEFQCEYKLQRYPFDTQVGQIVNKFGRDSFSSSPR